MFTVSVILLVLAVIAFGTLVFTFRLYEYLIGCPEGPIAMREVARPIQEGAYGFFKVQYTTIASIASIFAVLIYFFGTGGAGGSAPVSPLLNATAFLLGGTLSALSGVLTMYLAVRVNVRVAAAAARSYSEAMKVCFRGGLFGGLLILSNCLIGFILLYWFATMTGMAGGDITQVPVLFVGYAFGASFVALFAQLGGGIYTKAADVGADMVGKVDTGIPEDDPRNPATIADLVGDNVGDASGRSCDLFESISAELVGASILGGTLARTANLTPSSQAAYVLFPLCVHAVGLICSALGGLAVHVRQNGGTDEQRSLLRGDIPSDDRLEDPMAVMKRGFSRHDVSGGNLNLVTLLAAFESGKRSSKSLVALCALRNDRTGCIVSICAYHRILHGYKVPPSTRDCVCIRVRSRHERYPDASCWSRVEHAACGGGFSCYSRRILAWSNLRYAGPERCRDFRNGGGHHGHAQLCRHCPGDGCFRACGR
ncbi:VP, versatile peroxidase [Cyanidiococcus yangmingshanensis]|uniref:H(+)-exporting diphosphatase n=1 Tax=Cyanidiococcus yangmingshanensis TaxID=2690220 RepID=A0A7J7IM89_9RHOD|nr:VP, versatile peroxidase [Cyanidiococcus yangmingshanensis]